MSCKVEKGALVIRTRARTGAKARNQTSSELNRFLAKLDS